MLYLTITGIIIISGLLARRPETQILASYHPVIAVIGILAMGLILRKQIATGTEKQAIHKGMLFIAFLTLFSGLGVHMNLTPLGLHQILIGLLFFVCLLSTDLNKRIL